MTTSRKIGNTSHMQYVHTNRCLPAGWWRASLLRKLTWVSMLTTGKQWDSKLTNKLQTAERWQARSPAAHQVGDRLANLGPWQPLLVMAMDPRFGRMAPAQLPMLRAMHMALNGRWIAWLATTMQISMVSASRNERGDLQGTGPPRTHPAGSTVTQHPHA